MIDRGDPETDGPSRDGGSGAGGRCRIPSMPLRPMSASSRTSIGGGRSSRACRDAGGPRGPAAGGGPGRPLARPPRGRYALARFGGVRFRPRRRAGRSGGGAGSAEPRPGWRGSTTVDLVGAGAVRAVPYRSPAMRRHRLASSPSSSPCSSRAARSARATPSEAPTRRAVGAIRAIRRRRAVDPGQTAGGTRSAATPAAR